MPYLPSECAGCGVPWWPSSHGGPGVPGLSLPGGAAGQLRLGAGAPRIEFSFILSLEHYLVNVFEIGDSSNSLKVDGSTGRYEGRLLGARRRPASRRAAHAPMSASSMVNAVCSPR